MDRRSQLTLLSLNVRGIRDRAKRKNVFEWCKSKGSNIVLLQETYSTIEVENMWKSDWDGPMFFSHGSNHSRGVLVLLASDLKLKIDNVTVDDDGRYVILKGELQGVNLLIGNCYFPTRDRERMQLEFLEKLNTCILKQFEPSQLFFLGGDFNTVMNGSLDYMGPRNILKTKYNENFEDFLSRYNLEDIWRKRNPNKKQFTFRQKWPIIQSRLDYWFGSSNLLKLVSKCDILTSITPDHSGVLLQLRHLVDNYSFGKSYWKFNNSLCADPVFVNMLNDKIIEWKEQFEHDITDKLLFWDFVKMKMREYIISYSKEIAKRRRQEIEKLERELSKLEHKLLTSPTRAIVNEIEEKKCTLNEIHDYSRQGLRIRSRAEWYEDGEKNTQYFEQLLKSNKRKSVIREIYDKNRQEIKDDNEILKIIKSFYEKLYANNEVILDENSLFFTKLPKLSEESRDICEGKVTRNECYNVLKEMKFNKSPGNDGFTVEFYLTFWPALGDVLVTTLNESYDRGKLSTSQKQGVITLIEKDGKDPMYVQNYRPITLLNVDYKILSKVLANRIKQVLCEIIHYDQVGYIKDRNIGEAVRLIDDMLFHSLNQTNGFLVTVDFEKAFDSVAHAFLSKVLDLFGFGDSFRSWIKVLYTDISSCVMNGGRSTGYFDIKRGVRQGDPLSPYLFLLAIETLAQVIRKDNNIKGVQFGENEIRQILYADDISLFVTDKPSMDRLQIIFEEFEKISGLKVNKGKTNFLWMGKNCDRPDIALFGNLVQEVKILGVYFSMNVRVKEDLNYKEILSKIKRLLGWWKERDLTLMGKIHLIKTYALSKLNYVSSLIVVPQWIFSEVEQIIFEFLWRGKDRIKRKIMYQDYAHGGLKMTNFRLFVKTQRVMWLKRLLYGEKNAGWKLYFDHCFRSVGGRLVFICDFESSILKLIAPPFYFEIVKAWQDIEKCRNFERELINPIIYNNRNIRIRDKMIFYSDLYDIGICQLADIFENGHVKPMAYFKSLGIKEDGLLKLNEIISAIPIRWKATEATDKFQKVDLINFNIVLNIFEQKINFQGIKSRKIYEHFVKELQDAYSLQIRDGHNNFDFTDKEMGELFVRPRSSTLIWKCREFQFMLLHGVVYTKEQLMKFGFVADNLCSFCQQEPETYLHLFLHCDRVKQIWNFIIELFDIDELKNMDWKEIYLGISGNTDRSKCINSLVILLKYTIFKSRSENKLPSRDKIYRIILEFIDEEKKLALKAGRLHLHLRKWEHIQLDRGFRALPF